MLGVSEGKVFTYIFHLYTAGCILGSSMNGRCSSHARYSNQAGFRINRHCDICLGENDLKRNTYYLRRQSHKAEKRAMEETYWRRYHWGSNKSNRPLVKLSRRVLKDHTSSFCQRRSAQRSKREKYERAGVMEKLQRQHI